MFMHVDPAFERQTRGFGNGGGSADRPFHEARVQVSEGETAAVSRVVVGSWRLWVAAGDERGEVRKLLHALPAERRVGMTPHIRAGLDIQGVVGRLRVAYEVELHR